MGKITCSTSWCQNKVKYYNDSEDSYYCRECAYAMFDPGECTKIGSASAIDRLKKFKNYAKKEELMNKWKNSLDKLKGFDDEIKKIKEELENALRDGSLKYLYELEQRSFNLKFKITKSEIYNKYLIHKDINELRFKENEDNQSIERTQIMKDTIKIRMDEDNITIKEETQILPDLNETKLYNKTNFEDHRSIFRCNCENRTSTVSLQRDICEREERVACSTNLDCTCAKSFEETKYHKLPSIDISYEVLQALFDKFSGYSVSLNNCSCLAFHLFEEKYLTLLKILSYFKMPEVDNYFLNYVPDDSEDVKTFMKNSISFHKQFWFNTTKQVQIEGSKYIEALKEVARKTTDYFSIYYTNFSTREFSEIVSASKLCRYLYFYYDSIPLDCECDFGPDMEGCKIEYITFNYSGGTDYSTWSQDPDRFDNLVKGIAKCEPLSKSLKNLDISNCDLTKEKAQESMNRYKLKEIQLLGV